MPISSVTESADRQATIDDDNGEPLTPVQAEITACVRQAEELAEGFVRLAFGLARVANLVARERARRAA